ncbi:M1 family metallopeptidase [Bradyrhizobium sp. STM 3562]|uniref:M1 family metallopeptidase n=1 Tax=Bradyrhizobium sp. STM 3562 TaxID=578924 RepID=UPI00388FA99D
MTTVLSQKIPFNMLNMRHAAAVAVLAFALPLALVSAARAEATYSFETTPGKLPKTVVPTHYGIDLNPDPQKLTLSGTELVDIEVREPTTRVVLNAVNMSLSEVSIDDKLRPDVSLDAGAETATLSLREPLAAGVHHLHIAFSAKINPFARGLYYADYPTGQGVKRMIATQLEPADARRIFPCWDEPAFKATFTLTATVPQKFLAVGNMPVMREQAVSTELKRVDFAPTPKMSSYLFVFAAGELERITAVVEGVTVGVVTTSGKSEQGRFALENATKLLSFYNDYFGIKYPLPKLDLIAVPGGFGGAMENWGGITFFESRLLFDPATSADSLRRGIFSILAHEMAHQWFGDLVTMGWWDNLWLNEGFASWMQEKAAEHFYPQWKAWFNGYGQKQYAMALDARRTSHPIQQKVGDESEAMTAFDGITYSKGQAFIRMLENWLGETTFRDGIRRYMAAHAYGNATTADLWQALELAAGKAVSTVAASFTEQDGVPLVIAETNCNGRAQRLTLRQERFVIVPTRSAGSDTAALPPRHWQIPVAVGPIGRGPRSNLLLDGNAEIAAGKCGTPIKVNLGDIGYYRTEYGSKDLSALTKALNAMAPEDRLNFLADDWALVQAGRAEPPSYLSLLGRIATNDQRAIWDQVLGALAHLNRLARDRAERPALQAFARTILRPVFDRLGWEGSGSADDDDTLLRASLIKTLGEFGDADIIAEAKRRFERFLQDPASLPVALREPVAHVVGISADRPTYDTLLSLARKATSTDERLRYYYAAASAHDPVLARDTLKLALNGELPITIIPGMINTVASFGEQPELAWHFVQKHYDPLFAKLGPSFRDEFIAHLMTNFSDGAYAAELLQFAPAQATNGGKVTTARAVETIAISADLKARALPAMDAWIKEQANARP